MADTYLPADVMDRAAWFVHDRFGMFIHWGVYSVPGLGEWAFRNNWIPYDTYRGYAAGFNPTGFDANQWAQLARDAGMRYFIFTTKHHDGFCMFDNPHTDWKITNTPFGRDVTRELAEAYRSAGLKVGFYHSLIDWMHPQYEICDTHPLWHDSAAKAQRRDHGQYVEYLHKSVEHILTRYGQVDLLWVDYTPHMKTSEHWRADELMRLVRRCQPNVLIDDRLDSHERGNPQSRFPGDYYSPEQVVPASPPTLGGHRRVWESLVTMNDYWGYHAGNQNFKPTRALVHILVRCVANDGNLLLNVGPDATGRIPEPCVTRLREMGAWLSRYGQTIYGAGAAQG